jgi:hypothetical protein
MPPVNLGEFIGINRQELDLRCRTRAEKIASPSAETDIERGIPLFLNQLTEELRHESSHTRVIRKTAIEHGQDLFLQGFTVSQVVHDYGNVCQSVTDLAVELAVPISTDDFRTLNRCLDDAIAGAVYEYTRQQQLTRDRQLLELRTLIDTAIMAFEAPETGSEGVTGSAGTLVRGCLQGIRIHLETIEGHP